MARARTGQRRKPQTDQFREDQPNRGECGLGARPAAARSLRGHSSGVKGAAHRCATASGRP